MYAAINVRGVVLKGYLDLATGEPGLILFISKENFCLKCRFKINLNFIEISPIIFSFYYDVVSAIYFSIVSVST